MRKKVGFFEKAYDATWCRHDWHLCHTVDGEPVYFRRAGRDRALAYWIAPRPGHPGGLGNPAPKLVECAPNEGPWLCEACGTFVACEPIRVVRNR